MKQYFILISIFIICLVNCSNNFVGNSNRRNDDPTKLPGSITVGSVIPKQDGIFLSDIECVNAVKFKVNWKMCNEISWTSFIINSNKEAIVPVYGMVSNPVDILIEAINDAGEIICETWSTNSPVWPLRYMSLADVDNINNGAGTLGDTGFPLGNYLGRPLEQNSDFVNGGSLDEYYDNETLGFFSENKSMRIVVNGQNVSDADGLNLKPVAMEMSDYFISPPGDQVYIDPMNGRFCLPRPGYWNRFENVSLLNNHEIAEEQPYYSGTPRNYADSVFGNGIGVENNEDLDLFPFGTNHSPITKGTFSCWFSLIGGADNDDNVIASKVLFSNSFIIEIVSDDDGPEYDTYISCSAGSDSIRINDPILRGRWYHIYAVWDTSGGLSDGNTCRFFFNGSQIFSTKAEYSIDDSVKFRICLDTETATEDNLVIAKSKIDNLKIWKHVVTEDPTWLYNGGSGNENAFHILYGASGNYRPHNLDIDAGYIMANP